MGEIEHALHEKVITLHTKIQLSLGQISARTASRSSKIVETTAGRVMLLGELLPKHPALPFDVVNKLMTKKEISNMIDAVYRHCGQKESVHLLRPRSWSSASTTRSRPASRSARTTW